MIGVLGVGHIATDIVTGLLRAGVPPAGLLLSPRGRASSLAALHGIAVAADNTALVEASDVVLLCVRPADALRAIAGLPWRADQVVLSVAAGIPLAALATAARPATAVRAMPISAARHGASPTTLHPDEPRARALLGLLGPVIAIAEEAVFDRATVSAALYGWVFALLATSEAWFAQAGLPPAEARALVAGTFAAASATAQAENGPIPDLLATLATPGGITEAGLNHLHATSVPENWRGALDSALGRIATLRQLSSGG